MNLLKMRRFSALAGCATVALALLLPSAKAEASTISLVGDVDCFGLGGPCPDGTLWGSGLGGAFFTNYQNPGDPAFTDKWDTEQAPTYVHNYVLGAALSASLEIRTAGLADNRGPWDVFFNGLNVGQFPTNTATNAFEQVVTHSFVIPVGLLTGNDTILLAINVPTITDGFSIDYSQLTIETDAAAVPEPASLTLLGLGLASGVRRWRKRRTTV